LENPRTARVWQAVACSACIPFQVNGSKSKSRSCACNARAPVPARRAAQTVGDDVQINALNRHFDHALNQVGRAIRQTGAADLSVTPIPRCSSWVPQQQLALRALPQSLRQDAQGDEIARSCRVRNLDLDFGGWPRETIANEVKVVRELVRSTRRSPRRCVIAGVILNHSKMVRSVRFGADTGRSAH